MEKSLTVWEIIGVILASGLLLTLLGVCGMVLGGKDPENEMYTPEELAELIDFYEGDGKKHGT